MNNHNFSDKKPRNNPWLFLFVFVTSLLGVTSCQNNNSSSNQSNSLSKDSLTKINIENAIKEYNEGVLRKDVSVVKKFLYKDVYAWYNKFSEEPIAVDEFVKTYTEPSFASLPIDSTLSIDSLVFIDKKDLGEYNIYSYRCSIVSNKRGRTTSTREYIMAFYKSGSIELLAPSVAAIEVLKLKFSFTDVIDLLNISTEGNFKNELINYNKDLLSSSKWQLVAIGLSKDKPVNLNKLSYIGVSQTELELLPQTLRAENDGTTLAGTINSISNKIPLEIDERQIRIPIANSTQQVTYEISENGIDVFYLDIEYIHNNRKLYLLYEKN
jgi:hypothetical protein